MNILNTKKETLDREIGNIIESERKKFESFRDLERKNN